MIVAADEMDLMRENAAEAAAMLKLVGNENRLLILCSLVEGEMGVGALQERVDLSQSALSSISRNCAATASSKRAAKARASITALMRVRS